MPYPKQCELCGYVIEDSDDAMWWHGYGNCVEITDEMWAEWERDARMEGSKLLLRAVRRWIKAKLAEFCRYDLKGDLQMEARAARQDIKDAWYDLRLRMRRVTE